MGSEIFRRETDYHHYTIVLEIRNALLLYSRNTHIPSHQRGVQIPSHPIRPLSHPIPLPLEKRRSHSIKADGRRKHFPACGGFFLPSPSHGATASPRKALKNRSGGGGWYLVSSTVYSTAFCHMRRFIPSFVHPCAAEGSKSSDRRGRGGTATAFSAGPRSRRSGKRAEPFNGKNARKQA